MIYYAAGPLVHKIVVDLSRMVRVCHTSFTPKQRAVEGGKSSRMAIGKDETRIAISGNAGKKQVAARLRTYRDCTGDRETQLSVCLHHHSPQPGRSRHRNWPHDSKPERNILVIWPDHNILCDWRVGP